MIIPVLMLANQPYDGEGVVREVEIGEDVSHATGDVIPYGILNAAIHYGQNEHQPVDGICSVSKGDVVIHDEKAWLLTGYGYKRLTLLELADYLQTPRRDRDLSSLFN